MQPTKVVFRDEDNFTNAYVTDLDEKYPALLGSVSRIALYRNVDLTHAWMELMEALHREETKALKEGRIL